MAEQPERLRPSVDADWSEATRNVLAAATPAAEHPEGQGPPNILYTIGHHPALLPPFLGFAATLATAGVLTRRDSELLAMRASWNCRSAFEWGHHKEYALAHGLTEVQIDAIVVGPDEPAWSERDRLLLTVADELHATQNLSDATWSALSAAFSRAEIVEALFVVGNYTMLSMFANATRVPLEARLESLPPEPQQG
jgi:alkylhydroperoxidase family enzyme